MASSCLLWSMWRPGYSRKQALRVVRSRGWNWILEKRTSVWPIYKGRRVWVQRGLGEESKSFNKSVLGYVIGAAAYGVILVLPILVLLDAFIGGLTATSDWVISPMAIPLCLIAVLTTWSLCDLHFKKLMEVRFHEISRMKRDAAMIFYDLDKLGIDVDNLLGRK